MVNLESIQKNVEGMNRSLIASSRYNKKETSFANAVVLKYKRRLIDKLQKAFKENQSHPERIKKALTQILSENWQFVQGTLCGYTALPQDDLTLLLCDIAELCAEGKTPIELLMPGIQTESISNNYKNLDTLSLKTVLRTHITSDDCQYLLPVELLIVPAAEGFTEDNPYYNHALDGASSISEKERGRLEQHSVETQALSGIQRELDEFKKDTTGLWGQLEKLRRALLNPEQISDAYAVIEEFYAYWQLLPKEIQAQVPKLVQQTIQDLRQLSVSSEAQEEEERKNENIERDVPCISTTRLNLSIAISRYQDVLIAIKPHDKEKAARISNLCDEKKKAEEALKKALENPSYQVKEKAEVTVALLTALEVKVCLNSFNNILNFVEMTAEEDIQTSIKSKNLLLEKNDFEFALKVLLYNKELGLLLSKISEAKCRVFVPLIVTLLIDSLHADLFNGVLSPLNEERRTAVYAAMQEKLPELISTPYDFKDVVEYLNKEQRQEVYAAIQKKIPTLTQNFRKILLDFNVGEKEKRREPAKVQSELRIEI